MKLTLIDNAGTYLRHAWSMRLMAVGLFFQLLAFLDHIGLLNVWNAMPAGVQQIMPAWANQGVSVALFGAAMLSRVVGQPKLQAKIAEKSDGSA